MAAASIPPAHIGIAVLAATGIGSVWALTTGRSLLVTGHFPLVSPVWRWTWLVAGVTVGSTIAWGIFTEHGIALGTLSPSVSPFNVFWLEAIALTGLGAGAFIAIVIAWFTVRKKADIEAGLYTGTVALLVIGAIAWGALLPDFSTFHLFFGGIAVFGTPAAAVAVWSIWKQLRAKGYPLLALTIMALCVGQLALGSALGIDRLQVFGPGTYPPVPTAVLEAIQSLPASAKLAYACNVGEESGFGNARLNGMHRPYRAATCADVLRG